MPANWSDNAIVLLRFDALFISLSDWPLCQWISGIWRGSEPGEGNASVKGIHCLPSERNSLIKRPLVLIALAFNVETCVYWCLFCMHVCAQIYCIYTRVGCFACMHTFIDPIHVYMYVNIHIMNCKSTITIYGYVASRESTEYNNITRIVYN